MVTPPRTPLRADRLRALNVPGPVQVELDSDGKPQTVRRGGAAASPNPLAPASSASTTADAVAVEAVLETWRLDDEWWRQPITRRYYEVVIAGGGRVVLYEDLVTGDWWMQKP
jgi:hypothetical protein